MICSYCGQENPEGLEVCGFCGGSLAETPKQPVEENRPPEPSVEVVQTQAEPAQEEQTPPPVAAASPGGIFRNRTWWIVGCIVVLGLIFACIALVNGLYQLVKVTGMLNPTEVTNTSPSVMESTATSLPTSQTNAAVTTTETSTLEVLYSDDFSDPNSGWDEVNQSEYSAGYFENAYRITVNAKMTDSWANPGDLMFDDVRIEAEATKNGGPDDNDFGVICRYVDSNHFYYALVSSDGYYGISKVSADTTVLLGRENLDYSDLISQGAATNRIRFECVGNTLTLYVNGQQLDRQTDSEYALGNIGLIARTFDTPGTDILFDNINVYSP